MSNPDLLNQADRILRPVLIKLAEIPWLNVTACCAGHQPEDSIWFETEVRGNSGLLRLMEWLQLLEGKLGGTECRTDCLINYSNSHDTSDLEDNFEGGVEDQAPPPPHGWFPIVLEMFWPDKDDWRRGQALIVETLLSSIEDFRDRIDAEYEPDGALNYCPFCSSSFIRLETVGDAGHRYACGDCETSWTMVDPRL